MRYFQLLIFISYIIIERLSIILICNNVKNISLGWDYTEVKTKKVKFYDK